MMKSYTIKCPAETQMDLRCLPINNLLEDNYFATVPMIAFSQSREPQVENEEELYTSFEEAISERVARVSRHLSSLPLAVAPAAAQVAHTPFILLRLRRAWRAWRRAITLSCLALSLLMAGFDLMGLLVLSR